MTKLIRFLLLLATVLPAFAIRSNVVVSPLASVTATGALPDLNVGPYTRTGGFNLLVRNKAGTSPTLDVKLQQAALPVVGQNYTTVGTTINKLRAAATTTNKLAAKFTQSGAKSIKYVDLWLRKTGTIASSQTVTLDIFTNNAGVPSATSLGASSTVSIDNEITSAYTWVRFTFPTAIDLADATIYHFVLSGSYTASTSNYVDWNSNTVASAGNQSTFDATNWTAVATESHDFIAQETAFADITGGGYTQVTTSASHQVKNFELEATVSGLVRPYATIGGSASPEFFVACLLNAENR